MTWATAVVVESWVMSYSIPMRLLPNTRLHLVRISLQPWLPIWETSTTLKLSNAHKPAGQGKLLAQQSVLASDTPLQGIWPTGISMCNCWHTRTTRRYSDPWARHRSAWYCLDSPLSGQLPARHGPHQMTWLGRSCCKASTVDFSASWTCFAGKRRKNRWPSRPATSTASTERSDAGRNS